MSKTNLATELLKKEKRRTTFWFTAFLVTVITAVVSHLIRK